MDKKSKSTKEATAEPITKVKVKLVGEDGNAFSIIGRVRSAMRRAQVDPDIIRTYTNEATSGDYNHLLQVTMRYVHVNGGDDDDDDNEDD